VDEVLIFPNDFLIDFNPEFIFDVHASLDLVELDEDGRRDRDKKENEIDGGVD
jgi:hypothetical protein